jgi:hypothetical protein
MNRDGSIQVGEDLDTGYKILIASKKDENLEYDSWDKIINKIQDIIVNDKNSIKKLDHDSYFWKKIDEEDNKIIFYMNKKI